MAHIDWSQEGDLVTGVRAGVRVADIEALSPKVWEVVVRPPGQPVQVEAFATLTLAKTWASRVVNQAPSQ